LPAAFGDLNIACAQGCIALISIKAKAFDGQQTNRTNLIICFSNLEIRVRFLSVLVKFLFGVGAS